MKKYIFPVLATAAFITVGIYGKVLSIRCGELREKQAIQESILLKQSEILAVNTAILQRIVSSFPPKSKTAEPGKEGLQMDAMP